MKPQLYLLDTNTVSYIIKDTYPEVRARLIGTPIHLLAVSMITVAELCYWVSVRPQDSRLSVLIDNFLLRVPALPWEKPAAEVYGKLRARMRQMGKPVAKLDLLIAAHALAIGAVLVTHDRVFDIVSGLKTEDWVDSSR